MIKGVPEKSYLILGFKMLGRLMSNDVQTTFDSLVTSQRHTLKKNSSNKMICFAEEVF